MVYDGMAESVHVAITRWQTSHVAEPLSRAGKLTVTRYSVPQWGQAKPSSPLRVIRTIFFNRVKFATPQLSMFGDSASHPYEHPHPNGDRKRDQGALLDLARDSREGVIAELGAEFGCIMAETRGLVAGQAPAAAKALDNFVDRDRDGIADLVPGCGHARRGAAAGAAPELLDLALERMQAALEGGDVAVERRCTMVKHGVFL
jgi:hypothetical protein